MNNKEKLELYRLAYKEAGVVADAIGSQLDLGLGGLHGYLTDEEFLDIPDDKLGFFPGVGASRLIRRHRKVRKDMVPDAKWQRGRILSDALGAATLPLAGGAVGATIGGMAGGRVGALAGLGVGALPGVVATIAAAITRRRSREEQEKAERTHGALSYVVPGKATYDLWKRLGYSGNYDNEQRLRRLKKAFKARDKNKETKSE